MFNVMRMRVNSFHVKDLDIKLLKKFLIMLLFLHIAICFVFYHFWLQIKSLKSRNDEKHKLQTLDVPPPLNWKLIYDNARENDETSLHVMSAFYDSRSHGIIILLNQYIRKKLGHPWTTIYCRFFNKEHYLQAEVEGSFGDVGIRCPLNLTVIPSSVSLGKNKFSTNLTNAIPIVNLLQRKDNLIPKNLAMCVGIMFGYQNWLTLLQYIEYHRMQGVEKFIFFYSHIHLSTKQILHWYLLNTDLIETIKWVPPKECNDTKYMCQHRRNQYCLYSLMYKYKYVGYSDFDEIFTPTRHVTLMDLLTEIDRADLGSFSFNPKYHFAPSVDIPEWYKITFDNISEVVKSFIPLKYFNKLMIPDQRWTTKFICKPETVVHTDIHMPVLMNGFQEYQVEINEGFFRHFKLESLWTTWALSKRYNWTKKSVDSHKEVGLNVLKNVISRVTAVAEAIIKDKKFVK